MMCKAKEEGNMKKLLDIIKARKGRLNTFFSVMVLVLVCVFALVGNSNIIENGHKAITNTSFYKI